MTLAEELLGAAVEDYFEEPHWEGDVTQLPLFVVIVEGQR